MGTGGVDPRMQPVSMYYIMKNVDVKRLAVWAKTCADVPAQAIPCLLYTSPSPRD